MPDIAFARPALPKSGAVALLICEGEKSSGVWQQADEATNGAVARALSAAEFKGGKGKTCTILAPSTGLSRVVAVGVGKPAELTAHVLNEAGFPKARIVASSGFGPEKCRIMAAADAPIDVIGTGSYLPELWTETYATADIIAYDGEPMVKAGREFLLRGKR